MQHLTGNLRTSFLSITINSLDTNVCSSKRILPALILAIYNFTAPTPLPIRLPTDFFVTG